MKNWKWCMLPLIAAGLLGWPGVCFSQARIETIGLDISGNATYTVSEDVDAENTTYPSNIYGVLSDDSTSLEKLNIGDVTISATGGDGSDDQNIDSVLGVSIDSASDLTLENQGSISARAVAGDSTNSYLRVGYIGGMYIDGSVEEFSNIGTITADVSVGNNNATDISNYARAYEIAGIVLEDSINTFYNSGEIATNIEIGNGYGSSNHYSDVYIEDSYGAYFSSPVDTFENTGNITIQTIMGNSEGYYTYAGTYDIYGAYFENTVTNFMNSGTISADATVGDVNGDDDSEAYADDIYGIKFAEDVDAFSNSGTISADATVGDANGDDAYAYAAGIFGAYFDGNVAAFNNSGTISVDATVSDANGDNAEAYTTGIFGAFLEGDVTAFSNSGTISADATVGDANGDDAGAYAEDIFGALLEGDVTAFNSSGTINAAATVGDANGDDAEVYAESIFGTLIVGDVTAFDNSGTINAATTVGDADGDDAEAGAESTYGTYFVGDVAAFSSSGTISVTTEAGSANGNNTTISLADVVGVRGSFDTLENSGTISATAETGSAAGNNSTVSVGDVVGVRGKSSFDTLENSGTVSVAATTGDASGENSSVSINNVCGLKGSFDILENSGTISVAATAGEASGDNSSVSIQDVYGVKASDGENEILTNSGTILVEVSAGSNAAVSNVAGIADVNSVNSTIINTGTISVDATEGDTVAAIYLQNAENALISSSGHIYTTNGARALYLEDSSATLSDTFSVSLSDPTSSDYVSPIYVDDTSSLDLNDATLAVELAYGQSLVFDTPYSIIENDGTVTGTFGSLDALQIDLANPAITALWSGSDNGENAAVSFAYDPQASSAAMSLEAGRLAAVQGITMIQNRMVSQVLASNMNQETTLLADSGTIASDAGFTMAHPQKNSPNALFLRPYVTTLDRPSDGGMGYDGTTTGLVLGYDWNFNPDFTLGLHGGIAQSDIDYTGTGYDENSEDQDVYSLGAHASYTYNAWHTDISTTLYTARHEYDGLTGANLELDEEDDYTSYGAETQILGGYLFNFGNLAILPEAGIGHSWANSGSHTTDADDSDWDTQYDSYDDHVLYSILGVHFMGTWELGGARVIPSLGLRWEQALTDNDIAVSQSLPGTGSIKVTDNVSDASYIGDASLTFARDAVSMELGFTSQYNDDFRANGAWISFKWGF